MSEFPTILELWDFQDIARSETVFRDWMTKAPQSDPFWLELKTQLAHADEAKAHFQQAYDLLKEISWVEADRLERIFQLAQ